MLVRCKECKGQVSTKARACPHCGAPRGFRFLYVVLLIGVIYIALFAGYAIFLKQLF